MAATSALDCGPMMNLMPSVSARLMAAIVELVSSLVSYVTKLNRYGDDVVAI